MKRMLGFLALLALPGTAFAQIDPIYDEPALKPSDPVHVCASDYVASWVRHMARSRQWGSRTVVLAFKIAADGSTKDVVIAHSSGDELADASIRRCVSDWHYTPIKKDGQPVEIDWSAHVMIGVGDPGGSLGDEEFDPLASKREDQICETHDAGRIEARWRRMKAVSEATPGPGNARFECFNRTMGERFCSAKPGDLLHPMLVEITPLSRGSTNKLLVGVSTTGDCGKLLPMPFRNGVPSP